VATLAGATSGPGVGDIDGVSYEARFNSPRGVEAVSDDKVYVADALNNKVPRPSPRTNRTRRVPHPVPIGHAASLTPYYGGRISRRRRPSHPSASCPLSFALLYEAAAVLSSGEVNDWNRRAAVCRETRMPDSAAR